MNSVLDMYCYLGTHKHRQDDICQPHLYLKGKEAVAELYVFINVELNNICYCSVSIVRASSCGVGPSNVITMMSDQERRSQKMFGRLIDRVSKDAEFPVLHLPPTVTVSVLDNTHTTYELLEHRKAQDKSSTNSTHPTNNYHNGPRSRQPHRSFR
jgi:hypothetical protein